MNYLLLLLSFIVIIKASDYLIDSASSIATKLKVPKMMIALTIVAFGTCAPEIGISFNSIISGNDSMALANVIGSCIVNILLIIGISAITQPIIIKRQTIQKELPFLLSVTLVFSIFLIETIFSPSENYTLSRSSGIILVIFFFLFLLYLINIIRKNKIEDDHLPKYSSLSAILILIASLAAITIGSDILVDSTIKISEQLKISEKVITMIVIVIGTSLPELVMTLRAAKRSEFDIAVGNIIGTNIFNICIVLGLPVAIFGGIQIIDFNLIDIITILISTLTLYFFAKSSQKITKLEGLFMLLLFIGYYIYLFVK